MAAQHTSLLEELVAEFIEERVRRHAGKAFDLDAAAREISGMLTEAGEKILLSATDKAKITELIDRHPFVVREPGKAARWKPGLKKRK